MNAREAFSSIELIREQLARAQAFECYRTASTAFTGAAAFLAAFMQWRWGWSDPDSFLNLWMMAAGVGIAVVAVEMTLRCLRAESSLQRDATILAARQFMPAIVTGMLLTIAMEQFADDDLHLLPALWGVIFAMGIFASRPGLPAGANLVAAYYLLSSLLVMALADNRPEFAIWPMPLMFGVGQLMAATVLYLNRRSERSWAA